MRLGLTAITALAGISLASCTANETASAPVPLSAKQTKLLERELKGKVAGEAVNCITNTNVNTIRVSDNMLLYRVSGRLVYQNNLRYSCPGLGRDDDIIVSEIYGGQQCSGDIIRLVDRSSGIQGPTCSLGAFIPYKKVKS
jgi:hypothetical protein